MNNSDGFYSAGSSRFGKSLFKNRYFDKSLEKKLNELDKLWIKRERVLDSRRSDFDLNRCLKLEQYQKKLEKSSSKRIPHQQESETETNNNKQEKNLLDSRIVSAADSPFIFRPMRGSYSIYFQKKRNLETCMKSLSEQTRTKLPKIATKAVSTLISSTSNKPASSALNLAPMKSLSNEYFSRRISLDNENVDGGGLNITKVECVPKKTYQENFSFINTIKFAKKKTIYEYSSSVSRCLSTTTARSEIKRQEITTTTCEDQVDDSDPLVNYDTQVETSSSCSNISSSSSNSIDDKRVSQTSLIEFSAKDQTTLSDQRFLDLISLLKIENNQ